MMIGADGVRSHNMRRRRTHQEFEYSKKSKIVGTCVKLRWFRCQAGGETNMCCGTAGRAVH